MRQPASVLCALITLVGFWCVGLVRGAYPVLPPSFLKTNRTVYSTRDDMWFQVRVVMHDSIRTLRVELWELAEVHWTPTFHIPEATNEVVPLMGAVRYEPIECVRSSDEPIERLPDVKPRTIYPIRWHGVETPGPYEIKAKVLTNRNTSVGATQRIEVR